MLLVPLPTPKRTITNSQLPSISGGRLFWHLSTRHAVVIWDPLNTNSWELASLINYKSRIVSASFLGVTTIIWNCGLCPLANWLSLIYILIDSSHKAGSWDLHLVTFLHVSAEDSKVYLYFCLTVTLMMMMMMMSDIYRRIPELLIYKAASEPCISFVRDTSRTLLVWQFVLNSDIWSIHLKLNLKIKYAHVFFQSYRWATGHAIVQAISHRLPTAADRVQAQVRSCGICGGQSSAGVGFLRVLRFPLPIFIPPKCSTVIIIYHLGLVQ
jgi:hypothetical protein